MFKGKNVLVAGGTGMIGIQLSELLCRLGANLRIVSLDDPSRAHSEAEFLSLDLTDFNNCLLACQDMDYVFNLLGTKGSPDVVKNHPATMMRPMVLFSVHLFDAALKAKVRRFLFTSSIGVYNPAAILKENGAGSFDESDTEKTPPPMNDLAGRAKLYGEWYGTALAYEHNWELAIVRPANVYGPFDNFDSKNAMVVPSLIKKAIEASESSRPFVAWGNGLQIRDFIHAEDVARGMLVAMEKGVGQIINLGSGCGRTIRELTEIVCSNVDPSLLIQWDLSKPTGDQKRLLNVRRSEALGFEPQISLEQGVKETIEWFKDNRDKTFKRYDVFDKN